MAKQPTQFIIGGIELTVDDYAADTLDRTNKYRWPAQDRIAHPTALQFVGKGVEKLSLSGTAHHQWGGSMYFLDALCAEAEKGKPVSVATGHGRYLGRYCITNIKDGYSALMDDGRALENKWSIDLERYGED